MLDGLNSNTWMVIAYVVVAVLAGLTAKHERSAQAAHHTDSLLPIFWAVSAVLFASMAIAHAGEFGGAVANYARRGAYADGWYDARRSMQVIAVGAAAMLWAAVTLLALWRIPERRRRYLPMTIATTTLMCFSAIRLVSLHQVDTLLYRRSFEGLRYGVIIELFLLSVVAVIIDWGRRSVPPTPLHQRDLVGSRSG